VPEPLDPRASPEQRPWERADHVPDRARGVTARREDFPVLTMLQTRWRDNDVYGHVNNVVYYEYFDTAVNAWLHEQVGRIARDGEAIGVVAETTCRYLHEVSFPQRILVGLACERLGSTSITYRLAIFAADAEGTGPAALGWFVHVYVDRDTRRPVAVPAAIREAIQRVLMPQN
jgi:acyl-CoA thioester hydrolase